MSLKSTYRTRLLKLMSRRQSFAASVNRTVRARGTVYCPKALQKSWSELLFEEKTSGARKKRPQLERLLTELRRR